MNAKFHILKNTIYCQITVDKVRCSAFSTGIRCEPEKWNPKKQSTGNQTMDEELNYIKSCIFSAKNRLMADAMPVTARALKDMVTKNTTYIPSINEYIDKYLLAVLAKFENKQTRKNHKTSFSHYKAFAAINGKSQYRVNEITYTLVSEFQQYLIMQNKKPATINTIVSTFRLMIKDAIRDNYLKTNPCEFWKQLPEPEPEKIFLTMDELSTWMDFPLASAKMKAYRDMFTWMCLTGMYKSDLDAFREEHFVKVQGELFIDTERKKNGNRFVLRVHPKLNEIWVRYSGVWEKISEQKLNKNLKQLACMMGIEKDISIKSGRKTFANYMESKGIEPQRIADMMGHKHFTMTRKHYSKVQVEGIFEATKNLWTKEKAA